MSRVPSRDRRTFRLDIVRLFLVVVAATPVTVLTTDAAEVRGGLRAAIIGCDTSHAIAFTKLLNAEHAGEKYRGIKVVCAFPGGSDDIPSSRDRVDGYVDQLREMGVEIVDSLDELRGKCDVYFLESVDGRVHLEQFRAIAHGAPVFIDKPAAASLADLMRIFRIAAETQTPCFSASGLRFCASLQQLVNDSSLGKLEGASTTSPYKIEPHHPDLFWYGIHGVESLFTLMGPDCEQVSRTETDSAGLVVGVWAGQRVGVYRGLKNGPEGLGAYTFTAYGTKQIKQTQGFDGYAPLLEKVCEFFVTRAPPVSREETVKIFAAMEAADESKQRNGSPVLLQEMIDRARRATENDTNPTVE